MKLAVILGTTREGRKTDRMAIWALNTAKQLEDTEAELLDLKDYPMPFFNEAVSPRYNPERKTDPGAKKWLDKLAEFDTYLFVTAEYNHDMPGVLKNALDYIDWQFVHKPGAVISHGSAGGARAMTVLKEVLSENKLVVIPAGPAMSIVTMSEKIDEAGNMSEEVRTNPYGPQAGLEDLLKDLKWYSDALSSARSKDN